MDKELIERIAMEVADSITAPFISDESMTRFAHRFLARIDAERGKEAVAWRFVDDEDGGHVSFQKSPPTKEQIEYLARWNRPKLEPLFLSAPTIPEGMRVGQFSVVQGKSINQVLFFDTGLPDGEYTLHAAAQGERK